MNTTPNSVTSCKECGSTSLTWQTHNKNHGPAQEGRLRTHEISCLLVLGCDQCSETLKVISADKVATWLTESLAEAAQAKVEPSPIILTAVGELVDDGDGGLDVRWILEGGTAELFAGDLLLVADNAHALCEEDGTATVYQESRGDA